MEYAAVAGTHCLSAHFFAWNTSIRQFGKNPPRPERSGELCNFLAKQVQIMLQDKPIQNIVRMMSCSNTAEAFAMNELHVDVSKQQQITLDTSLMATGPKTEGP